MQFSNLETAVVVVGISETLSGLCGAIFVGVYAVEWIFVFGLKNF